MCGLLIIYVLFIHMMPQHVKSGLKQVYFSVCRTYLKFIALIRQRKAVIHAAFYFMWRYRGAVHPGVFANICGWAAEEPSQRLLVCLSKMSVSLISSSCYIQEYPEHTPVSYLIYEDNAEIHIILYILGIFCGFSWEIFQLEMKLFMSKENEESQKDRVDGARSSEWHLCPGQGVELNQLLGPFQPRILSFYENCWFLLLSFCTRKSWSFSQRIKGKIPILDW